MQVPNVLILSKQSPGYHNDNKIVIAGAALPNIRKSSAYYVWIEFEDSRIWHIREHLIAPYQLTMNLGNSYVFHKRVSPPDNTNIFNYLPVTRFGLMQLSPGVLVALPEDINLAAND